MSYFVICLKKNVLINCMIVIITFRRALVIYYWHNFFKLKWRPLIFCVSDDSFIWSFDHIRFFFVCFVPSVYIHFRHSWYPISVLTLIPAQNNSADDCLLCDYPLVLNGHTKMIYIICVELAPWLFDIMDKLKAVIDVSAQNLTERI